MDNKKIESRKRRRIVDDEEDDDSEASNDIDRPIIDVEEDDDDSEDEDDNDDGDYNVHEDDDDEASNDVDDDEVVDKSSNPPGINDSLAFSNKGGEKRSGSIVVNVEQGCNPPPPLPPTRAGAGAGADLTRPRSSGGARPHSPPRRGRRGADRMLPVSCGVANVHLEEELIHNRISGTRGGKKIKKKIGGILHPPSLMAVLSVVIQVQTQLVPLNLPHLFLEMSDLKPFPKITLTMNICAHIAGWSIRLLVMIYKIHRFLFSYADIDFAESASIIWGGGRIVP